MELERLQPPGWPRPRGYSNGFRVPAGSDLVMTGGMIGWDANEQLVPGGFAAQFEQTLRNIVAIVEAAGGEITDITRLTWFIIDKADYLAKQREVGEVYRRVLGRHFPTMSMLVVAGLIEGHALLEIEATAVLKS